MEHAEQRKYLIQELQKENPRYRDMEIPAEETAQRLLLRSLMNMRMPGKISAGFMKIQDEYLQAVRDQKGVVRLSDLKPISDGIYLWRGDITRLECGAIVNAANSGMTGCYVPCHNCIDNCIHTYAGIQLRLACAEIMEKQGHEEPCGQAKITPAFNLPCRYVIHTVGPAVQGQLTQRHCDLLASCYQSCLELADANDARSIAFCCISTGVFLFPNEKAAEIAVQTVKQYKAKTASRIEVIFNVFKEQDEQIYRKLLEQN